MSNRNTIPRSGRATCWARAPARIAAPVLLACAAACLPSHPAFLRVPVAFRTPPTGGLLTVTASCADIRQLIPDFEPAGAAFYSRGRAALPFLEQDDDGDGRTDRITVTFPSLAGQAAWLIIVYPAEGTDGRFVESDNSQRVKLDFTRAQR